MESSGEGVDDDQGSGWLEVKKKHRSSSKFLLQGWVGGFSGKHSSKFSHSQPLVNEKIGNSHGKHKSSLQKVGGDFATREQGSFANRVSVSSNEGAYYHDKCIVNQDNKSTTSPPSVAMIVSNSTSTTGDIEKIPQVDMPVAIHKIKWGDIEDDVLVLHCEKTAGAEIKFGDIDNDNLMVYRTSENDNNTIPCQEVQGNEMVKSSGDVDIALLKMNSSSPRDKSSEENCKEVNEISLKNVEVQLERDRVVDEKDDVSNCKEIHHEHTNPIGGDPFIFSCPPEVLMMEKLGVPDESEVGDLKTFEEPITCGVPITVIISQTTELLAGKSSPETHAESSMTTAVEGCRGAQGGTNNGDMSRAQMTGDLGDGVGDAGESKERFRQRLWCFLFENLNRAVDELYLLCELECDLEQLKEAILVLEEAAYDFKELKSRVQKFENVKKSSHLDGMPVTLKTDHRRPHALSWEVRRMTTSPHRAEILSSSLEAFKKIQHERASMSKSTIARTSRPIPNHQHISGSILKKSAGGSDVTPIAKDSGMKSTKQSGCADLSRGNLSGDKRKVKSSRSGKVNLVQNGCVRLQNSSTLDLYASRLSQEDNFASSIPGKCKKEQSGLTSEKEKLLPKKDKPVTDSNAEKSPKFMDRLKRHIALSEKEKEKSNASSWSSMDAWKEKRNWEDILASPFRVSSRVSHSPGLSRKSAERALILRDKLMSPEKKKKTALDLKKEAEEKHARAMRIRGELEIERVQKLQRTSEKLNRVNEWQTVRSMKLREGMDARHQRSVSRHEAFLAQVVRRAGDESSKVNEVRFITSLNEENKKLILRQKLHGSELRRAEKLQVMKSKQREDMAREEAVLERRKLIEAEKLQRLAETQRKKEEAQVRREEERRLSSVAREAKAIEQLRRKEIRAKAQQEEAELFAQKLAERLSESEQRRKIYLEQIRERASMDFRDQSSPLLRRSLNKDSQSRSTTTNNGDDCQANIIKASEGSTTHATGNVALQQSLKRRIKRIRQRLMALKYEISEPPVDNENSGIGYRTAVGTARAKIGRWLQELQRLRQARKEGAASIGLITAEIVKFLDGRDPELLASRQAGLLDFIASALPASHISKPEACQVTIYLLRVLRVVLSLPANRSYFLSQNLLPPIIPMLSAALENYIKIAASLNVPGGANLLLSKTTVENFESISEVLDGFLWTVITIIDHLSSDERQLQMQDGLLELLVAYQVIQRLRDLFALYDRPQVEGSPFPSSILLSINLLMVLTSRPRTISSIDWESFGSATATGNDTQETRLSDSTDVGFSFVNNYGGDCRPPLSVVNGSVVMHLPDVPEDRPLDESCKTNGSYEPGSFEKELTSIAIESNDVNHNMTYGTDESQKKVNNAKSLEPQKDEKSSMDSGVGVEQKNENILALKQPLAFLLSAISETGLVSLPSLLTAVLLQANNRLCSEQASYVLPSNFVEVAAGVLKVLNNLALIDITLMQKMLARPDLKMEFFHLMSFLLSHCTSKWKVAGDQVGLLLLESLLLLGYFSLFHPGNQAVLRWGKSPTILHKVCDLPFVFFSDPDLMPVLAGTLVAACYGCEQNKCVVQQELSVDMLLSLLTSCKNSLPTVQSNSRYKSPTDDSGECNHLGPESKKILVDTPLRPSRYNARSARASSGKGGSSVNSSRIAKIRNQRDSKSTKGFEDYTLKQNQPASETSSIFTLHGRFPPSFIDRAEQFFSASSINMHDEA